MKNIARFLLIELTASKPKVAGFFRRDGAFCRYNPGMTWKRPAVLKIALAIAMTLAVAVHQLPGRRFFLTNLWRSVHEQISTLQARAKLPEIHRAQPCDTRLISNSTSTRPPQLELSTLPHAVCVTPRIHFVALNVSYKLLRSLPLTRRASSRSPPALA